MTMPTPGFHSFSAPHIAALGILAGLCFLVARTARKLTPSGRNRLGRSLALLPALYGAVFYVLQARAGVLSWEYSLPLDLCSVVLVACTVSLIRPSRFLCEITYFWGLGGTLQALVTPDLAGGFPSRDFFLFFWGHGAILVGIAFIIAARKFRPRRDSVLRMMVALNVYALALGAINALMDWNYGYLCGKPAAPSLLDLLGPWPWYLLSLEGIALLTFFLLFLPWKNYLREPLRMTISPMRIRTEGQKKFHPKSQKRQ
ncbi:MAG: TIGR02206 family membrane protein [Acidobacteria bacterium]|nr:TIGR02206 family membrane protein [Acidobacteriota bacterium]